ncbi:MAG: hypothetical protein Q8M76_11185, partial [Spirochaetaceae bacterium]|nr:hypothetical protein [Spirochaetaceae bacterium]
ALNDGNEPNNIVGAGPTVYSGESFHGYLSEGDYDAYTLDFSRPDPLAGTDTRDDDFVLSYPLVVNDAPLSWTSLETNDGDGRIEPGETALILLNIKTRLDPLSLTGWTAWIYAQSGTGNPTLSGYMAFGGSAQFGVNASGPTDLKQFFEHSESESSSSSLPTGTPVVYAQDRSVGLYLWIPAAFAGSTTTLSLRIYDTTGLYGTYTCPIPISR